jgi:hypothetical protein
VAFGRASHANDIQRAVPTPRCCRLRTQAYRPGSPTAPNPGRRDAGATPRAPWLRGVHRGGAFFVEVSTKPLYSINKRRRLYDPWVSVGPVVAVSRQEAHAIAIAVNYGSKTIVFDFVNPMRTGWHLGATGRDRGLELHDQEDMRLPAKCRLVLPAELSYRNDCLRTWFTSHVAISFPENQPCA